MKLPPCHDHSEQVERRSPRAEVMEVVRVEFLRGTGCCEESPARIVVAYFDRDGTKLAESDTR